MSSSSLERLACVGLRAITDLLRDAVVVTSDDHVADVLAERIGTLPEQLRRSLTWDQGRELSEYKAFSIRSGVKVYFPWSPWQRGSNENTNGLLRQYLPRGLDFSTRTQAELDQIADQLNRRPRKTLAWRTPAEKMLELLGQDPREPAQVAPNCS